MAELCCSFLESSLQIVKGAVCTTFSIPTARATKHVKKLGNYMASLTIGKLDKQPSDNQYTLLKQLIDQKIAENANFRVLNMNRELAESIYGDSFLDDYTAKSSVNMLKLVILDEWTISSTSGKILKSTGHIKTISIDKIQYDPHQKFLILNFKVVPGEEVLCDELEVFDPENCPTKVNVLPPGEVDLDYGEFESLFNIGKGEGRSAQTINYDKLIKKFGCTPINKQLLDRMEKLVGMPLHPFLRRGLFFCHRGLDEMLDMYERGSKFYIYTGRGPSSEALHLGHLIPFIFTCWLQKAFKVPVVIMLSDDEKFLFREELDLEYVRNLSLENAKDIIACGFDPDLTFIFRNTDYITHLYKTSLLMQKKTPFNQVKGTFGFDLSTNIGMIAFPTIEGAAAFSQSFPTLFNDQNMMCLIPQGIDQDPFFRLTRGLAPKLGFHKPALIHSKFIPSLLGVSTKMSSSFEGSVISVTDTPEMIRKKINKYAFSGGRDTAEEHRRLGANLDVDVSYQYLYYLLDDDELLDEITKKYSSGEMLTGEVKNKLIELITPIILNHQECRKKVDDKVLEKFMCPNHFKF